MASRLGASVMPSSSKERIVACRSLPVIPGVAWGSCVAESNFAQSLTLGLPFRKEASYLNL